MAASDVQNENLLKGLSREQLESVKQVHLDLITRLDEHHDAGEIPDALYHYLREEQKALLGQVINQLESA
jgi:hypothetical protein